MKRIKNNLGIAALCSLGVAGLSTNVHAAWPENVAFSGNLGLEGEWNSGYGDADSSMDLIIGSFTIGLDAELNDRVSTHIGFLYEEDGSGSFDFDTGYLSLDVTDTVNIMLGKMVVPFGSFNSVMVKDPFALALGETNETAAAVNFNMGMAELTAYIFNGDHHEDEESMDSVGFRITGGSDAVSFTFDYMNNLNDRGEPYADTAGTDFVGGMSVGATASISGFDVNLEYLAALDEITTTTAAGKEPNSFQLEVSMNSGNESDCYYGIGIQQSEDAEGVLPETRFSFGYGRTLMDAISLSTELYFDSDYEDATDESATGFIARIDASF